MIIKKLNEKQEREVALSYSCTVSPQYIKKHWGVCETTAINILNNSLHLLEDPLIDLCRNRNKAANAIHIYLTSEGESEGLRHTDLIDLERDASIVKAVKEDVFVPRTARLIGGMGLVEMLQPDVLPRVLSPEEGLLKSIFGIVEWDFNKFSVRYKLPGQLVRPFIYESLRTAYNEIQRGELRGKSKKSARQLIDSAYDYAKREVAIKIGKDIASLQDEDVMKLVSEKRQQELAQLQQRSTSLKQQIGSLLLTLNQQEREVINLKYGLSDGVCYTHQRASELMRVSKSRIGQIEKKALRKLHHPTTVAKFYELLPPEHQQRVLNKDALFSTDD